MLTWDVVHKHLPPITINVLIEIIGYNRSTYYRKVRQQEPLDLTLDRHIAVLELLSTTPEVIQPEIERLQLLMSRLASPETCHGFHRPRNPAEVHSSLTAFAGD